MPEVVKHQLAPDLLIVQGHVIDALRTLPDKFIQCFVTSDPYYQQRNYGEVVWEGGAPNCNHGAPAWADDPGDLEGMGEGGQLNANMAKWLKRTRGICPKCGAVSRNSQEVDWPEVTYIPMAGLPPITVPAWRGAYGLEPSVEMYIGHLVLIRRVMRDKLREDGTHFMNLGDKAAQSGGAGGDYGPGGLREGQPRYGGTKVKTLKPKDIIGIPWRAAFALQADGWYLRSDIIWSKPNPFPESVLDRPSKSHEYIFLLTKNPDYFYDADAIREPQQTLGQKHEGKSGYRDGHPSKGGMNHRELHPLGRNKRTVWEIATESFDEAHFATFPLKLPETCIKAGTSPKACPQCGAPWWRVTEKIRESASGSGKAGRRPSGKQAGGTQNRDNHDIRMGPVVSVVTTGWEPTCSCEANDGSGKCWVGDIFLGSGTTALVARALGRAAWGSELSAEYTDIAKRRLLTPVDMLLLETAATKEDEGPKQATLFDEPETTTGR